jgi:zinc protease
MIRPLFRTALLLLALPLATSAAGLPFPQEGSDLRPDSAMTFGALPNGLRYIVMPNKEPKGRASFRLLVLAGSFEETETERGLAHYLEHMAFNGSTHYAPGTMWETFQRLGMGIGADTNASTSYDRTLYQIDLPNNEDKMVTEGLQILSDMAGGLLLEQKMVDKERGIILSEKRDRDSVEFRTWVARSEFLEAGTLIPKRVTIGLSDVIEKATREQFVSLYNTWYRPENMVVIVVGDIDGPTLVKKVADAFGGVADRAPEVPKPDLGHPDLFRGVRVQFHSEPEAPVTSVTLAAVSPHVREPDNAAKELREMRRILALDMLDRRLDILSKQEGAPFIRAQASVDMPFEIAREAEIAVTCKPDQWASALRVADVEIRRALQYGFRPEELKEAVADERNNLEQALKTASTRLSSDLSDQIAQSLLDGQVFTSPKDDLDLFSPMLDKVTADECTAALRTDWSSLGRSVFVSGNLKLAGDVNAILKDAYMKAEAVAVTPTGTEAPITWGYTDFGAPGTVASRTHVDDLDLTEVVFSNGVRLNFKKTDFEANTVHVAVRLGEGQLSEPAAAEPGLSTFAVVTYSSGGLGKHSLDDLRRIVAGKTVGSKFVSSTDAFLFSGETNREDLALEFQLLAASVSDPGYRPESIRVARKKIEAAYTSFEHTLIGPLDLHVNALLAGGDPRFGLPPHDQMMSRTLDEVKAWLTPELAHGAIEIAVSGDADLDAVTDAVAKTFGALPKRGPRPPLDPKKIIAFPDKPFHEDYGIDTKIPKALVGVYWPATDGLEIHRQRRLNLLGDILEDRLRVKVREQLGSAYSPEIVTVASDVFPGYGYYGALIEVDPAKAHEIQDVVVAVAAELASGGTNLDEITRAKNPILSHISESERTNGYWMTVLGRAQERPEVLDWARSRRADFESINKADMDALAKTYLGADHASRFIIHPYPTAAASPVLVAPGKDEPPPDGM